MKYYFEFVHFFILLLFSSIVDFSIFRGSKNRGSMDTVHIFWWTGSMGLVHGGGPWTRVHVLYSPRAGGLWGIKLTKYLIISMETSLFQKIVSNLTSKDLKVTMTMTMMIWHKYRLRNQIYLRICGYQGWRSRGARYLWFKSSRKA